MRTRVRERYLISCGENLSTSGMTSRCSSWSSWTTGPLHMQRFSHTLCDREYSHTLCDRENSANTLCVDGISGFHNLGNAGRERRELHAHVYPPTTNIMSFSKRSGSPASGARMSSSSVGTLVPFTKRGILEGSVS